MTATINPAGRKISAVPILVNSINENMSKLAKVARFSFDLKIANHIFIRLITSSLNFNSKVIESFMNLGVLITLAHRLYFPVKLNRILKEKWLQTGMKY